MDYDNPPPPEDDDPINHDLDGWTPPSDEQSPSRPGEQSLAQLIDAVNVHTELLQAMTEQIAALQSGDAPAGQGGWTAYGADQTRLDARVLALREWLQWAHPVLFQPHLPDPFPACWSRHHSVVEELLALHAAWLSAYAGDPSEAMIAWHDRWLQPSLARMWHTYGLNGCSRNGEHTDRNLHSISDDGHMVSAVTADNGREPVRELAAQGGLP